ncbi:chemotaxis protein CheB [Sandaracinus amylolyticus]|uniref:protein-glutamate methylesterase n=1 Tax=Sandaracinus amylolyticus TaxID=927083 RepID=A0A0F6SEY2_9BACT|nr:chemotaxis protein CheB [Sandaracinus amylolyticus]AKF05989.1 Chemotaxis response regulator protein-glutamate methylesterase CheB [Sandaracinus amylolyticus]
MTLPPPSTPPTRVLIVHDSPTVRASLRRTVASDPRLRVVGELDSALHLVEAVGRLAPDVVVMDVVMPEVDGYQATRALMASRPTPIVLVSQVVDPSDASVALEAIRAGALAIVDPPPPPSDAARSFRRDSFLSLVRSAANAHPSRGATSHDAPVSRVRTLRRSARVIGIVASAGGPAALSSVLEQLPRRGFPPLLVVQHLAKGFSDGLARWLAGSGHPVSVGGAGERVEPGHVYVAPEDRHIGLTADARIAISDEPPVGFFRPSGTWMLSSLARALGPDAGGVVLTGMGDDGAAGARALRDRGGEIVAQDEASSVVFGMPRATIACGAANEVLSLRAIAQWIVDKRGGEP